MSEAKACIRCARSIDRWAAICPYCNWDQNTAVPADLDATPSPAAAYRPAEEKSLRRKVVMMAAGAMLLVASFGVGMVINRDGTPKNAPETLEEQAAEHNAGAVSAPKRANTQLVPAGVGGVEQPITSAPSTAAAEFNPNDASAAYDRTDATAVSAVEYAEMAKRAQAEKERAVSLVDPRSLTGAAYAQAPRRPMPPPRATAPAPQNQVADTAPVRQSVRTRPIAEYQPVPSMRGRGTAKLTLLIGSDGDVKRVNIDQPLQNGNTAALIAAVQRWRFRPATENGRPVAAPYSVEINFK